MGTCVCKDKPPPPASMPQSAVPQPVTVNSSRVAHNTQSNITVTNGNGRGRQNNRTERNGHGRSRSGSGHRHHKKPRSDIDELVLETLHLIRTLVEK